MPFLVLINVSGQDWYCKFKWIPPSSPIFLSKCEVQTVSSRYSQTGSSTCHSSCSLSWNFYFCFQRDLIIQKMASITIIPTQFKGWRKSRTGPEHSPLIFIDTFTMIHDISDIDTAKPDSSFAQCADFSFCLLKQLEDVYFETNCYLIYSYR